MNIDSLYGLIGAFIFADAHECFGIDNEIYPIEIKSTPSNDELLSIAINQQKRIVLNGQTRNKIMNLLNTDNLKEWYCILESSQNAFNVPQGLYKEMVPYDFIAKASVISAKELQLEDFISFLDSHFGENFFPKLTFEDASVIVFIKVTIPNWFDRLKQSYQVDISRYIKYISFALKTVIEKIENLTIDPFSNNTDIKTCSASQNILLYLNKMFK